MEKKALPIVLILSATFLSLITYAQSTSVIASGQNTFQKTFGGPDEDWAQTGVALSDSSFVFTGITYSWGNGGEDFLMVKIDKNGNVLWEKTFGGPLDDYGYRVLKMRHDGFLIVGHTDSFGAGDCDGYVVRTNDNGDTIWTKTYGGVEDDRIHGAVELANGDLVMVGWTENFGAVGTDVFLVRTDSMGNTQWIKTIGGNQDDEGECIYMTPDGNLLLGGNTNSFGNGSTDYYILKTDTGGNIIWQKTFGTKCEDMFWHMQLTSDGALLGGYSFSADTLQSVGYLVKINYDGAIKWETNYGSSSCTGARYITATADGGYLVAGDVGAACGQEADVLLSKIDSVGSIQWQKTFGGPLDDNANYVSQTLDSSILILGRTVSYGAGWSDCYMIKTDNLGNAATAINIVQPTGGISIYPNPSSGELNVKTSSSFADGDIQITDLQGKICLQQKLAGENTILHMEKLAAGTYCYKVTNGSQTSGEGKFVLDK